MTPTAQKIKQVWEEILGLEQVDPDDNFFDLGGNSLDIIKVSDGLKKSFNIEGLTVQMFKYSTINALADFIDNHKEAEVATLANLRTSKPNEQVRKNRASQRMKRRSNK
ncbi:MAG: acyl carrier protein [Bacteroidota bacterium]